MDGNDDRDFDNDGCTHTGYSANNWWMVTLDEETTITEVVIANRNYPAGSTYLYMMLDMK